MKVLKFILPVTASLLIATNVVALDVKDKLVKCLEKRKSDVIDVAIYHFTEEKM